MSNPDKETFLSDAVTDGHPHKTLVLELDLLLRARYPLLYIVSVEEESVEEVLNLVATQSNSKRQVLTWDLVRGWDDNGADQKSVMGALNRIAQAEQQEGTIFVLRDLHIFLNSSDKNSLIIRGIKNLVKELKHSRKTLILTSHTLVIPEEFKEEATIVDFPLPNTQEIDCLISQLVASETLELQGKAREQLIKACRGLSRARIQRALAKALAAKQMVDESDIEKVLLEEKKQAIRQTGILEFFATSESLKDVGGLENLKKWIKLRKDAFTEEARRYGIPNPKGVLLVGIQGTGKSLSAKTIANEWHLPLLRLDTGHLFGEIIGESESRVRQMIQIAEAVAPCVLWIDEIDKAFGNLSGYTDGDSGTSRRVFGSLIAWMQEKTSPVFVVATANNIKVLPAELLRKGRFDEIFFLNLPTEQERRDIFKVHLQKLRPSRLSEFNLNALAKQSNNFSGAEIEQVIVDALYYAFSSRKNGQQRDIITQDILQAIEATVPLATIARSQIDELKQWAAEASARTASEDVKLLEELKQYAVQLSWRKR